MIALLELLRTGRLGPVSLGMSREQVRAALGEPELTGGTSRRHPTPSVWKYGSLELFFPPGGPDALWMIFTDDFPLRGGAGLALDPGWLRGGLPLAEARARLGEEGLAFEERGPELELVRLVLASGVRLVFGPEGLGAIERR